MARMEPAVSKLVPRSGPKLLALLFLLILSLLFIRCLESPNSSATVNGLVRSGSLSSYEGAARCDSSVQHVSSTLTGPITETWDQLRQLFEEYPPVLKHEKGIAGAPSAVVQISNDSFRQPESKVEAKSLQTIHQELLAHIPPQQPQILFKGRGVVMLAGGSKNQFAATSLGMLRLLGSQLPVELWFLNRTLAKEGWCPQLAAKGITCRYLSDYVMNTTQTFRQEEQQRAVIILLSTFAEVLYLHSDAIPVVNPDAIFESQPYKDNGIVTWPDFFQSGQSPWADVVTGVSSKMVQHRVDYGTIDEGQILWDKQRHWKLLVLTLYYNHFPAFFHPLLEDVSARSFASTIFTAIRVVQAPFHRIPFMTPVPLSAQDGGPEGSGVCVFHLAPSDPQEAAYLFLRTSIHRFGVRDLMCDETCVETAPGGYRRPSRHQRMIGSTVRTVGAVATANDWLYGRLHDPQQKRRTLAWKDLEARGLDPEKDIWRVLERLACEKGSVWNQGTLCSNVREYVNSTFPGIEYWREGC